MIYCIDKVTGQHCPVNDTKATRISTPSLEGEMMFLIRDDDSDDHHKQTYFQGKRRRFDLQFQFRLQQETKSIWYGIELDDPLTKLGTAKKIIAKAGLKFCERMNPGSFHSQISTKESEGPSCMAFKVENSMDRIAINKPGQPLPCLGEAPIEESTESIQKRAKIGLQWNQEDTYTISCFSSYFDFMSWTCSVPGLPSFDATSIVGKQPFRFAVYTLEDETAGHVPSNKNYIVNLELSHPSKTGMGPAARAATMQKKIVGSDSQSSLSSQATVSTTTSDDEDFSFSSSSWDDCSESCNRYHGSKVHAETKVLMKGVFF